MMNRANQNWPEEVIEINSDEREYTESYVDWCLRVIDNALESR